MSTSYDADEEQYLRLVEGDAKDAAVCSAILTIGRVICPVPIQLSQAILAMDDPAKIVEYANNVVRLAEIKMGVEKWWDTGKQLSELSDDDEVIYNLLDVDELEEESCAYSSKLVMSVLTLAQPEDPWAEEPGYPRITRRFEVSNEETNLGYWDWVETQRAQAEADLG